MIQATLEKHDNGNKQALYMACDLSLSTWKLTFGIGGNPRIIQIPARDLKSLSEEIAKAKKRFGLREEAGVVSCYEAGRDGFWIHRHLLSIGVQSIVVDSSSIEVNRRQRRAKTDRIDAGKLYTMLMRHDRGEGRVWSVVRVPSREDEDERRPHRELERLQKERVAHSNRIKSLLVTQGIVVEVKGDLPKLLESVRLWDGSPLSPHLKAEIEREYSRMKEVDRQIQEIRKGQREALKVAKEETEASPSSASLGQKAQTVIGLTCLRGIGERSAWTLGHEFLWREFANRREVASAAGLVGTPYDSGGSVREQGISKAGNKRIRRLMVELSWCWLRYQPDSAITIWFNTRFGDGGKRMRRIGIVGVARRLLVALWKYASLGEVPEGARFKEGLAAAATGASGPETHRKRSPPQKSIRARIPAPSNQRLRLLSLSQLLGGLGTGQNTSVVVDSSPVWMAGAGECLQSSEGTPGFLATALVGILTMHGFLKRPVRMSRWRSS